MANIVTDPSVSRLGSHLEQVSQENELKRREAEALKACGLGYEVYRDKANRLLIDRETERGMDCGEFLAICQRNLHPRWVSIRILRTRWGEDRREEANLPSSGTVQTCNWTGPWEDHFVIPCPDLPYFPSVGWEYDDDEGKWRWDKPKMCRGWRGALVTLVEMGVLAGSRELTWLTGEDTCSMGGKWRLP